MVQPRARLKEIFLADPVWAPEELVWPPNYNHVEIAKFERQNSQ